jgi:hypothetical protein
MYKVCVFCNPHFENKNKIIIIITIITIINNNTEERKREKEEEESTKCQHCLLLVVLVDYLGQPHGPSTASCIAWIFPCGLDSILEKVEISLTR